MELSVKIEGVLFYKAAPMKKSALCKLFEVEDTELSTALQELAQRLQNHGICLAQTDSEVELVTAPELDTLIESVRKDEMKRDIGKAGAETLAIILYKGPISRAEIDRIRGVNSSFILRNLLVRGLVEREMEKNSSLFSITPALLSHMGLTDKTQLPNYATVLDQLEKFEAEQSEQESHDNG
jgi:segregation and condensation protein B